MMATTAPGDSFAPGPGAWNPTVPRAFLSSVGEYWTSTWNPAASSWAMAASAGRPTTAGTRFTGTWPFDTLTATWVPATAVLPPAGNWPTTTPLGWAAGALSTAGVKYESTRTWTAWVRAMPTTSGTRAVSGAGTPGSGSAGRPRMATIMKSCHTG